VSPDTVSQDVYHQIADILLDLEMQLRAQSLWAFEPPPFERLQSQEPFCLDTLDFPAWLQFVLIPRMSILIEAGAALPKTSQITPMAEEYFRGLTLNGAEICSILERFDLVIALYADDE
jgi:uncharacterized protein YqcC (DUF446 family)